MSEDLDREAFRKWARGTFGGRAEQFEKLVDRVLGGTRRTRRLVACPKCTHSWRVDISVGDDRLALELFRLLSKAGFGRPGSGEEASSSGESFVFVNKVALVDADGMNTLEWLDERGLLGRPLAAVERAWTLGHVTPVEHAEFIADYEDGLPDEEG